MAKLVGRNANVIIVSSGGPSQLSNVNQVTINFTRELTEARVFQNEVGGGPWTEQFVGFHGWTINVNGFYDDASPQLINQIQESTAQLIYVYEKRGQNTRYWYGSAWFNLSEDIGVDNVVTVNLTGTGNGPLYRSGLS